MIHKCIITILQNKYRARVPSTVMAKRSICFDTVPLDTVQHILKYIKFKERGEVALGLSTKATAKHISKQLMCSFFWGGFDIVKAYDGFFKTQVITAGSFLLRSPWFEAQRNNKSFVQNIVERDGSALEYAGPGPKGDWKTVLTAVKEYGFALKFADAMLKKDRVIVMAAVKQHGLALYDADPEMKKDKEIVLAAVKKDGGALHWADPEMKKDREIVLAAVKQCGLVLSNANREMKKDKEIVQAAAKQNGGALMYADPAFLWANPEISVDRETKLAAMKLLARADKNCMRVDPDTRDFVQSLKL